MLDGMCWELWSSRCLLTEVHSRWRGGTPLAKAVVSACQDHIAAGRPFYHYSITIHQSKNLRVATRIYGADGINIHAKADRQLKQIKSWGYGSLPVCMAKTQYSFSHDPNLLGAQQGSSTNSRIQIKRWCSIEGNHDHGST